MTDVPDLLTVAQEVAEVSRLSDGDDVTAMLRRYVDRVVRTVEGCDHASITVAEDGGIRTVSGTEDLDVIDAPEVAGAPESGPIQDAVRYREPRRLADTAKDRRWPRFSARLATAGFRCALVLPLAARSEPAAALTLFSRRPDQFGDSSYDVVLIFTLNAGVAFDNVELYHDSQKLVSHLRAALVTRSIIGQAQGLLMGRHDYTAERAFRALRDSSQHLNVKLRDLAADVVAAHTNGNLDQQLRRYYLS